MSPDNPPSEVPSASFLLPTLPIETGRHAMVLGADTLLGREAIDQSTTGTSFNGDDFEFTTGLKMSYGLWQFPGLAGMDLIDVSTTVSFAGDNDYYLAVSNYSLSQWDFFGPYTENATVSFSPGVEYKSGADNFYVAVITSDFNVGLIHGLSLSYDEIVASYSISGTVTDSSGSPIPGITLGITPDASQQPITDTNGNYTFVNIPVSEVTIFPESAAFSFSPSTRDVLVVDADVTGVDFTGAPAGSTYSISGRTHDYSYFPIPGVSVVLMPGGVEVTSDSTGAFEFTNLADNTYTVIPSLLNYTFSPLEKEETVNGSDVTGVNFFGLNTGTPMFYVSGTILDGNSRPLPGTGVIIEPGGHTDEADGTGNYVVYGLTPGSYTVYPTGSSYNFTPTEISVFVIDSNVTGNHFRTY